MVAVLLVREVATTMTALTSTTMRKGGHSARPPKAVTMAAASWVFSMAAARLSPPPKRIRTSQGIFRRQVQSSTKIPFLKSTGTAKRIRAVPIAMTSSVRAGKSAFQSSRLTHSPTARRKAPVTTHSGQRMRPSPFLSACKASRTPGKSVLSIRKLTRVRMRCTRGREIATSGSPIQSHWANPISIPWVDSM